jgi:hypothetical protein
MVKSEEPNCKLVEGIKRALLDALSKNIDLLFALSIGFAVKFTKVHPIDELIRL